MKTELALAVVLLVFSNGQAAEKLPLGEPGKVISYKLEKSNPAESTVIGFDLTLGPVEDSENAAGWLRMDAKKGDGSAFSVYLLCRAYPVSDAKTDQELVLRYILAMPDEEKVEYFWEQKNHAVLPATGAWPYLLPKTVSGKSPFAVDAETVELLGHRYRRQKSDEKGLWDLGKTKVISLTPDFLLGVPHNRRVKDGTRRYDESDYEYVRMTRHDFDEMIDAGFNVFRVDAEQLDWIKDADVYYWGLDMKTVPYPEILFKSNFIGPVLFIDEPMARTSFSVLRPRAAKDPGFRKSIKPKDVFDGLKKVFHDTKYNHGPTTLIKGLAAREDVDLGTMTFLQKNIYTWDTGPSSAAYQLSEGGSAPPDAMVFEPPGRFGARRVLPEINICFGCQIPVDDPKNLISIIYGFLRGAARVTDRQWGMSIYGAVDRSDAGWYFTHAYDLGATRFFFWDSYQLAAVPPSEYLAHARLLSGHRNNHPRRDLEKLKRVADTAILLPPGYDLGYVHMGRSDFAGVQELNLERKNEYGVSYRTVMGNFFLEIERCLKLGIPFDLFWNLENLDLTEYGEVVTILEDGRVEIVSGDERQVLKEARRVERPKGKKPGLTISHRIEGGSPWTVTAEARVSEETPIFYTPGADRNGVYNNQYVLWEVFGPNEEDYSNLWTESWNVEVDDRENPITVRIRFDLKQPGKYRLRASTCDLTGRSTVVWRDILIP